MDVHGCGVGAVDGADAGVEAHPSGRKDISIMLGRVWEVIYPL
jgi:hypothetical protein